MLFFFPVCYWQAGGAATSSLHKPRAPELEHHLRPCVLRKRVCSLEGDPSCRWAGESEA